MTEAQAATFQSDAEGWPKRVALSKPILAYGREYSELFFGRPRAGHMKGMKLTINGDGGVTIELDQILTLAARLAEMPPASMDQLDYRDVGAVIGALGPLF